MKLSVSLASVLVAKAASLTWEEYKQEYGLSFNGPDDGEREASYAANVRFIEASNREKKTYTLGVNKFTYMPTEEFLQAFTGESSKEDAIPTDLALLAPSLATNEGLLGVDWSLDTSVVGPVENQGHCGSCWAFAAAGETEMIYALKTGTLYTLSKQQLVDCALDAYDNPGQGGCEGGLSSLTWQTGGYYERKGSCASVDYPYKGVDLACADDSCTPVIPPGAIVGFMAVPRGFPDLKKILMERPLKVSVHADEIWHTYESGVAQESECYTGTNHAVIAVGYDGDSSVKIRNSWGPDWGLGGHILITQTSDCETGPWSVFYREPYYPEFAVAGAMNV